MAEPPPSEPEEPKAETDHPQGGGGLLLQGWLCPEARRRPGQEQWPVPTPLRAGYGGLWVSPKFEHTITLTGGRSHALSMGRRKEKEHFKNS